MGNKQIIGLAVAAVLAGCTETDPVPGGIQDGGGYMILAEDASAIVQLKPGSDPIVSFFIVRAASDSLVSRSWEVNGKILPLVDTAELGRTWDRDDILPEGVQDAFSALVPTCGDVEVRLLTSYRSGASYAPKINYHYGND